MKTMGNDSKVTKSAGKPELAHLPLSLYIGVNRVMTAGAVKHGRGNWATVNLDDHDAGTRYMSALLRHGAELQSEDGRVTAETLGHLDADSGLPTIDHMIATLFILRNIGVRAGVLAVDPGVGLVRTDTVRAVEAYGKGLSPEELQATVELVDGVIANLPEVRDVQVATVGWGKTWTSEGVWRGGTVMPMHAPRPWPTAWEDLHVGSSYLHPQAGIFVARRGTGEQPDKAQVYGFAIRQEEFSSDMADSPSSYAGTMADWFYLTKETP